MSQALERAVRAYVAEGSDLDTHVVIPGNSRGTRPLDPYASVLLINDIRNSYPIRQQLTHGQTIDLIYRRATFSVQWYRKESVDMAEAFDTWAMSENGLTQAETAFADGRIDHLHLLNGGSGYTSPPTVDFIASGGGGATAVAGLVRGAVSGVTLTSFGEGYVMQPKLRFQGGGGSGAVATAQGAGFRIVFPLTIRRLDEIISDSFEERVQMDLGVDYATISRQEKTGEIDTVECDLTDGIDRYIGEISIAQST